MTAMGMDMNKLVTLNIMEQAPRSCRSIHYNQIMSQFQ